MASPKSILYKLTTQTLYRRTLVAVAILLTLAGLTLMPARLPSDAEARQGSNANRIVDTALAALDVLAPPAYCSNCWGVDGCYGRAASYAQEQKNACLSANVCSYDCCEDWADRMFYKYGEENCPECPWVKNSPYITE